MAKKQKYPKEVYLEYAADGKETYLVVHESPDSVAVIGEEIEVAIYKFVRIAKVYSGVTMI